MTKVHHDVEYNTIIHEQTHEDGVCNACMFMHVRLEPSTICYQSMGEHRNMKECWGLSYNSNKDKKHVRLRVSNFSK